MKHLQVDVDQAFAASRALGNDAVELGEELDRLQHHWHNVSREWSGTAAATYCAVWEQWLEAATLLVDALEDRSQKLGMAAVSYAERDSESGAAIGSAHTGITS